VKLLLDSGPFLWMILGDPRLSARARDLVIDPDNELLLSVVSAWEISIKSSLGRLPLPDPPARFITTQRQIHAIQSLPLEEEPALYWNRLPRIHTDPFDRMLICQAIVHGLALLTPDEWIAKYPVRVLW